MFNIGPQELLIILIVALVVVGPKRLPELGRTIGRGLNEFRKLQDEVRDMVKFDLGGDAFINPPAVYEPEVEEIEDEPEAEAEIEPMTHSERVVSLAEPVAEESADDPSSPGIDAPLDDERPDVPPVAAAD